MSEFSNDKNTIVFGHKAYESLNNFLTQNRFSKVFVLCDENTQEHCIPYFFQQIYGAVPIEILEIESGETHKEIATCQQLWTVMTELGGDRSSILINLGGGVITDMGGFVASTFLRGIPFINVPTTLLSMVDASVGGKTGVNREGLKNQIGLFRDADLTIIDTTFLGSLPQNQMKSGLAEMFKHGLIADKAYWEQLQHLDQLTTEDLEDLVKVSIKIKTEVTHQDQTEKGLRKILNYGHTLGHAIESYCLNTPGQSELLHGEAVAIGMILEAYLSYKTCGLKESELADIKTTLLRTFHKEEFWPSDIDKIMELLQFDKKNQEGKVNFVLLEGIGKPVIDQQVSKELIQEAFDFYKE